MRLLRRRKSRTSGPAWLIVGLGNPGNRYTATRHNAGARSVESLARNVGLRFKAARRAPALVGEGHHQGERLIVARPGTFMNESGRAVAALASYYGVGADRLIVVHDDLDLEEGTLRLKRGGGSAGHNGLESVEKSLGTRDFYRVRIGIGRPTHSRQDPADFVLEPMPKEVAESLAVAEERAAEATLALVHDSLEAAQRDFH